MGNVNIPANLIGYYEDWADGLMIEVEAVHVKDIPAIVAGELERIAEDDTGWAIGTYLRRRAAELKADQR